MNPPLHADVMFCSPVAKQPLARPAPIGIDNATMGCKRVELCEKLTQFFETS
jgi:hypothetical protein